VVDTTNIPLRISRGYREAPGWYSKGKITLWYARKYIVLLLALSVSLLLVLDPIEVSAFLIALLVIASLGFVLSLIFLKTEYAVYLVLFLIPFQLYHLLPLTVSVTEALIKIAFIFTVAKLFTGERRVIYGPVNLILAAFLAVHVLAIVINTPAEKSAEYVLPHLISGLLIYIIVLFNITTERRLKTVVVVLAISALCSIAFMYLPAYISESSRDIIHGYRVLRLEKLGFGQLYGSFADHNYFAGYMGNVLCLLAALCLAQYPRYRIPSFLCFLFVGASVIISGSKSGILAMSLALLLMTILSLRVQRRYVISLALAGTLPFVILDIERLSDWIAYHIPYSTFSLYSIERGFSIRLSMWNNLLDRLWEHSLIGHGTIPYTSIPIRELGHTYAGHAHNFFIDTALTSGLIGLGLFGLVVIVIVKAVAPIAYQSSNRFFQAIAVGLLGSFMWFVVQSFFHSYAGHQKNRMILWVFVALAMVLSNLDQRAQHADENAPHVRSKPSSQAARGISMSPAVVWGSLVGVGVFFATGILLLEWSYFYHILFALCAGGILLSSWYVRHSHRFL
jgi:O-antigen ligase